MFEIFRPSLQLHSLLSVAPRIIHSPILLFAGIYLTGKQLRTNVQEASPPSLPPCFNTCPSLDSLFPNHCFFFKNSSCILFSHVLVSVQQSALRAGWRRQCHPTPVLLPGKSHGRRSLVGCSPWGHEELDTAPVCGVAQSRTRLKRLSSSSSGLGSQRET